MLYDPKWFKPTGDLSIPDFIAWLETQDPAEEYDFCWPDHCAVAQYLKSAGAKKFCLDTPELPEKIRLIVHPLGGGMPSKESNVCRGAEWTFGAALERARALAG